MDHSVPGILWCLTRLQVQCEAVICVLERQYPGFQDLVYEEVKKIHADGRALQMFVKQKSEMTVSSDEMWLKNQGIDPTSPAS